MNENAIGDIIVDSAINLHRSLGPGLLETVYEVTLAPGAGEAWIVCRATGCRCC